MKKLLIAILFALMVIPVKAEETIVYHGVVWVSNYSVNPPPGVPQPHSGTAKLRFLRNGDIEVNGVLYKKFYGSTYEGVDMRESGSTIYKLNSPIKNEGDKCKFMSVKDDKSGIKFIYFNSFMPGSYWRGKWCCFAYDRSGGPSPSPGINPSPSPSPTPKVNQGRTCAGCRGTGVCTMCQGKGGYYTNSGYYTGSGSKTWHTCSSCGGSGKCGVCYGKGTIR